MCHQTHQETPLSSHTNSPNGPRSLFDGHCVGKETLYVGLINWTFSVLITEQHMSLSRAPNWKTIPLPFYTIFHHNENMPTQSREARIMLAIEAIQAANKLSIRKAVTLNDVPETSVRRRMNGHPSRAKSWANGHILERAEEDSVVQYILDLDTRGFPPRMLVLKIWPIYCLRHVVRDAWENNGHIDLLIANQSLRRVLHVYMAFNELYEKIQSLSRRGSI